LRLEIEYGMDGYMVSSDMVSRGSLVKAWRCRCGAWCSSVGSVRFGRFGLDGDAMGSGLRLVIWRVGPRGFHSFGSAFTVIFRVLHRPFGTARCPFQSVVFEGVADLRRWGTQNILCLVFYAFGAFNLHRFMFWVCVL